MSRSTCSLFIVLLVANSAFPEEKLKSSHNTIAGPVYLGAQINTTHTVFKVAADASADDRYCITVYNASVIAVPVVIQVVKGEKVREKTESIAPGSSSSLLVRLGNEEKLQIVFSDGPDKMSAGAVYWQVDIIPKTTK
jgi:hypothetical protein